MVLSRLLLSRYSCVASGDPVHQRDQAADQQRHGDQPHQHDVQWIELLHVLLQALALADAQEGPGDRPCRAQHAHPATPGRAGAAAVGAAGVPEPTSKKVYDSVIVVTSFDSFGSMTNATGHCFFSPGSSVYWLKQKHSTLLKCEAACRGA